MGLMLDGYPLTSSGIIHLVPMVTIYSKWLHHTKIMLKLFSQSALYMVSLAGEFRGKNCKKVSIVHSRFQFDWSFCVSMAGFHGGWFGKFPIYTNAFYVLAICCNYF